MTFFFLTLLYFTLHFSNKIFPHFLFCISKEKQVTICDVTLTDYYVSAIFIITYSNVNDDNVFIILFLFINCISRYLYVFY